jgi:hypothetical protein
MRRGCRLACWLLTALPWGLQDIARGENPPRVDWVARYDAPSGGYDSVQPSASTLTGTSTLLAARAA